VILVGKVIHVKFSNVYLTVVSMVHVLMANVCVIWDGVEIFVNLKHVHMNATIMVVVNLEYVYVILAIKENIVVIDMLFMVNSIMMVLLNVMMVGKEMAVISKPAKIIVIIEVIVLKMENVSVIMDIVELVVKLLTVQKLVVDMVNV